MDAEDLCAAIPLSARRFRMKRSAELEAAIIEAARRGAGLTAIASTLGVLAPTIYGWSRRDAEFRTRLHGAIEEGRRLNSAVDRAVYLAGEKRLGALLPRRNGI